VSETSRRNFLATLGAFTLIPLERPLDAWRHGNQLTEFLNGVSILAEHPVKSVILGNG
jgi:hypothetical protein